MKKLLAILLVLMLALPCVALAEPSTAYTIGFKNPVITFNGDALDMTGLNLELSALVSDAGKIAAVAQILVGENHDNAALTAQAQMDSNGLTFTADGMSNVYSFDLTQFTNGFDVSSLIASLPFYSMLKTPIEMESVAVDMSLSARYAAIGGMFGEYNENGVISIDRTEGELLINQLLTSVESAASSTGIDMDDIAELRELRLAFDMEGSLTADGDPAANNGSYTLSGKGMLYSGAEEESLPYDITLTDASETTVGAINLYEPDGTEVISITFDSESASVTESRLALTLSDSEDPSLNEEFAALTFTATPDASSPRVDYVTTLTTTPDTFSVTLAVATGTNGDDIGFGISLDINNEGEPASAFLTYTGAKTTGELGTVIDGHFAIGGEMEGESAAFETGLLLSDTAMDTADWAYDSTGAIDVESMDETQMNTAAMGLLGIAGTAMTLINENVPGLAPLLGSMMG